MQAASLGEMRGKVGKKEKRGNKCQWVKGGSKSIVQEYSDDDLSLTICSPVCVIAFLEIDLLTSVLDWHSNSKLHKS